jgi:hypothetical protein
MKSTALKVLLFASVLAPVAVFAQSKPDTATFIMKEDIDAINKAEQSRSTDDENAKVVDLGYEHFSVGVIHRASTRNPPPPAAPRGANAGPPPTPCGRQMASVPADALPGGITHDFQTEAYYIISGGGTVFVDGYIVRRPQWPDLRRSGGRLAQGGRKSRRHHDRAPGHGAWLGRHSRPCGLSELPPVAAGDAGGLGQSHHRRQVRRLNVKNPSAKAGGFFYVHGGPSLALRALGARKG